MRGFALVLPVVVAAACAGQDRPPVDDRYDLPVDGSSGASPGQPVATVPTDADPVDDGVALTDFCADKTDHVLCDDFEHNDLANLADPLAAYPWTGNVTPPDEVLLRRAAPGGQPGHALHALTKQNGGANLSFGLRNDPFMAGSPNATLTFSFMVYVASNTAAVNVAMLTHGGTGADGAAIPISAERVGGSVWHNVVITVAMTALDVFHRTVQVDDAIVSDVTDGNFAFTAASTSVVIGVLPTTNARVDGADVWIDRVDVRLTNP